jgi:ricin-type beta-trefoil lectin protein
VKSFMMLGVVVLAAAGCTTTYVAPTDPIPVIGAQLMGSSGSCADMRDGVTADGTPIILFQCHGSSNQRWFIRNGGISQNVGSCVDVQGGAPVEGSSIILVSCNGAASQRWSIIDGEIVGAGGLCLSSMGGAAADLTPLVLSPCKAAAGQLWTVQ